MLHESLLNYLERFEFDEYEVADEAEKVAKNDGVTILSDVGDSLLEDVEFKNISDDDEYWDRVKIIARNKSGEEECT